MPERSSKRPADANRLSASIVAEATADGRPEKASAKNPAAVELGRLGGLKGGVARARKLSKKRRSDIAKKAAAARWGSRKALDQIIHLPPNELV